MKLSFMEIGDSHQTLLRPSPFHQAPLTLQELPPPPAGERAASSEVMTHVLLIHACVPGAMGFTDSCSNKAQS